LGVGESVERSGPRPPLAAAHDAPRSAIISRTGGDNRIHPMSDSTARYLSRDSAATPAAPSLRAVPEDGGADEDAIAAGRYRRRVILVLAALATAFGLYWGSSYVFAYTDEAYVTSDLVAVAPQVTGRVVAVPIVDNESVIKGRLLARIDPTPFRLALAEQEGKLGEA
jgi:hypothetical protein